MDINLNGELDESEIVQAVVESYDFSSAVESIAEQAVANNLDTDDIVRQVMYEIDTNEIAQDAANEIDLDDVAARVADNLDVDSIADDVSQRLDLDDIASRVTETVAHEVLATLFDAIGAKLHPGCTFKVCEPEPTTGPLDVRDELPPFPHLG